MEMLNRLRGRVNYLALSALLLGVIALGLAACDSGSSGGSTSGGTSSGGSTGSTGSGGVAQNDLTPTASTSSGGEAKKVEVDLKEWTVELVGNAELAAGAYNFTVANVGSTTHDLVIQDSTGAEVGRTPIFKKEDGDKFVQADLKPGTYKFLCDLPGHAEKGMKTDVTVK
jgi:plastocyanin